MASIAVTTAAATACSRCEREFSLDGNFTLAGLCATCPDGEALCKKCVDRHTKEARFRGHDCRTLGEVYAGADLLARLGLNPAPKACLRHEQPFLGLRCSACASASTAGSSQNDLCVACVKEHTLAHPAHALTPFAPDVPGLRTKLLALAATPSVTLSGPGIASSTAAEPQSQTTAAATVFATAATAAPLIESARRRALAAQAELDALPAHKEAALAQIDANRDAVIAAAQVCHRANTEVVETAAADKQTKLEAEVVAADAALGAAIAATAALAEAAAVLDDADIVQHAPVLTERFTVAQAAVAAIPEQPVTSSFLAVGPAPGPEALRATVAGLMGALSVARVVEQPPPPPPPPHPPGPAGLSPEHAAQLQAWLPPGGPPSPGAWQEVYRATTHGFSATAFHERCDGHSRLLVLVRAQEGGWLFGGFTAKGFSRPPAGYGYIADRSAFLFSLTNSLGRPERLASKGTGADLYYFPSLSAAFVGGLRIHDNADTGGDSCTITGGAFAASASTGAHPMAQGEQHFTAAEVVAWCV